MVAAVTKCLLQRMDTDPLVAPRLAVVICTYNRSASLVEALDSLYGDGHSGQALVDIVVVANRCTDDTLATLSACRARHAQDRLRLRWIEEPKAGKSHALNSAIAHTDSDALCFVDDDQVVEPGFLACLGSSLAEYSDADILCGRIWPAWDGSEPSWVHAKPPYAIPIRPFPEFDLGSETRLVSPGERWPSGGNITVRRRVFERVGGFSADLGPSGHNLAGGEDHDFIGRAVEAGFRIRYLPGVRQLHAIDPERMRTAYVLKKSFQRSRSSFLIDSPTTGPQPYMVRKVLTHGLGAAFSLNPDQRFYLLVRAAASLGELKASVETARRLRAATR